MNKRCSACGRDYSPKPFIVSTLQTMGVTIVTVFAIIGFLVTIHG